MRNISVISNNVIAIVLILFVLSCSKEKIYVTGTKPEVFLNATNARMAEPVIELSGDSVYVLASSISLKAGQTLNIAAGALIKVQNQLSLTIEPNAKINVSGTAEKPVIFTSTAPMGTQGVIGSNGIGSNFWYGIRINGDPGQPAISSGTISYLRIEFAGGDEDFLNIGCLQLNNVSSATQINNIQVSYSFGTPSFGFSGGNVNASKLLSYASSGNDFYINNGFNGFLQFILAYRHPFFPVLGPGPNLAGVFIEGEGTNPVISNLTVLGPDSQKGYSLTYSERDPSSALLVNGNAKFKIRNSVLMGFPKTAVYINERNAAVYLQTGESELTYSFLQAVDTTKICNLPAGVYPPFNEKDFKEFVAESRFNNFLLLNAIEFGYANPFDYNNPNPSPDDGSPLLMGADFSGNIFSDAFFTTVPFRGATGIEDWLLNWTNFIPLQTNYNN